mmetsp:Transcript_55743/g.180980  ORF Transcript_55743/g.180980 Transcript_55743/m.180980 type:complete len:284 (-) Transcript_55743:494-1345(-)
MGRFEYACSSALRALPRPSSLLSRPKSSTFEASKCEAKAANSLEASAFFASSSLWRPDRGNAAARSETSSDRNLQFTNSSSLKLGVRSILARDRPHPPMSLSDKLSNRSWLPSTNSKREAPPSDHCDCDSGVGCSRGCDCGNDGGASGPCTSFPVAAAKRGGSGGAGGSGGPGTAFILPSGAEVDEPMPTAAKGGGGGGTEPCSGATAASTAEPGIATAVSHPATDATATAESEHSAKRNSSSADKVGKVLPRDESANNETSASVTPSSRPTLPLKSKAMRRS